MTTESPLAEAQPESLAELFARDPLKLTDQDVDTICKRLLSQMETFNVKEAQPKEPRKKRQKFEGPVSLDDLGL